MSICVLLVCGRVCVCLFVRVCVWWCKFVRDGVFMLVRVCGVLLCVVCGFVCVCVWCWVFVSDCGCLCVCAIVCLCVFVCARVCV